MRKEPEITADHIEITHLRSSVGNLRGVMSVMAVQVGPEHHRHTPFFGRNLSVGECRSRGCV